MVRDGVETPRTMYGAHLSPRVPPPLAELPRFALDVPLARDFRFVHEPLAGEALARRYVGREDLVRQAAERLCHADAGTILITGYRGVGKTSFVNRVISAVRGFYATEAPTEVLEVRLNVVGSER